ncbi:MAG: polysaccharide deacetylase family protein [Alcanivoracaceae bacterium]
MKSVSLCYHDVIDQNPDASGFAGASAASYKLERSLMEAHFATLAVKETARVSRVDHLSSLDYAECPLLLTFDDGGISAITDIADLLETHGWRGHFFITAGRIGQQGFVNTDHIRALHHRGHLIGSHSWSHPARISLCDDTTLLREWADSVQLLSEIIGEPVETASVPGGYYSQRVADAAASSGIRFLFTSEPEKRISRHHDMSIIGRYSIQRHTTPAMALALASATASRAQLWQYGYWNSKKLAKRLGGNLWLVLREAWWARKTG